MTDWDKKFIGITKHIALWSKDTSSKNAALVVNSANSILSSGYNGFPRGVDDSKPERYERPAKYLYTEHAERNAVYNAARQGVSLDGGSMYVTMFPCADCARAIIQSGIIKLITPAPDLENVKWGEQFKVSLELLNEAKVIIQIV